MRYVVVSAGLSPSQIEVELKKISARGISVKRLTRQVFCELDESQLRALERTPGLRVRPVREIRAAQITAPQAVVPQQLQEVTVWQVFSDLRNLFAPPLSGRGLTIAVLDSGIRKTHRSLRGKVVYEANFTDSSTLTDVFGHGTQVAFVAAGCDPEGETGVAPGAKVMNIKVLNDEGVGTEESIISGIEEVCELVEKGMREGIHPTEDLFPNIINLSLGAEDDGDPENPVRVACREAVARGVDVVAAVGNQGPKMTTVMLPACDPQVVGVGALESGRIAVWEKSSRGPTLEGKIKPDFVLWGTGLRMASEDSDDGYITKSGTSFSCPMISGLTGLLWEAGRRSYGDYYLFRWGPAMELAPYYCVKPAEAPRKKDNNYGYGLPAMGTLLGQVTRVRTPEQQMMETFPVIMMLGLVGRMMGGMA